MIVLVRHAESHIPEPDGPDDHHRSLTARGHAQAEALVDELAALSPIAVVSSPYLRAVQTVEPIARRLGLPVHTDPELREWDSGLSPRPDYAEHYAASWADPTFARPGGESLDELTNRALRALTWRDGPVIVGSHGTFVSRALAGFGVAVDWAFSQDMPMPAVYRVHRAVSVEGPGVTTPLSKA